MSLPVEKIFMYCAVSILILCTSCNKTTVCEEVIEKLQLNENGFCGIELGNQVSVVAEKIGNVDPAKYSGYWVNEINEKNLFDGVKAHIIATFPRLWLTGEYEGTHMWQDDYTGDYGVSRLLLSIPCDKDSNKDLEGKRVELYETICEHYLKQYCTVKETDDISTLFQKAYSEPGYPDFSTTVTYVYVIFVMQHIDGNSVNIVITKE